MDDKGHAFLRVAYDFAIMFNLMELACGHVSWINEIQYLYNMNTGLNDYKINGKLQK